MDWVDWVLEAERGPVHPVRPISSSLMRSIHSIHSEWGMMGMQRCVCESKRQCQCQLIARRETDPERCTDALYVT